MARWERICTGYYACPATGSRTYYLGACWAPRSPVLVLGYGSESRIHKHRDKGHTSGCNSVFISLTPITTTPFPDTIIPLFPPSLLFCCRVDLFSHFGIFQIRMKHCPNWFGGWMWVSSRGKKVMPLQDWPAAAWGPILLLNTSLHFKHPSKVLMQVQEGSQPLQVNQTPSTGVWGQALTLLGFSGPQVFYVGEGTLGGGGVTGTLGRITPEIQKQQRGLQLYHSMLCDLHSVFQAFIWKADKAWRNSYNRGRGILNRRRAELQPLTGIRGKGMNLEMQGMLLRSHTGSMILVL